MPILSSRYQKWYPRKKPSLQLAVLKNIASHGKSTRRRSQRELGSHYADIHEAYKSLQKYGLIKPTGDLDKNPKQRASTYYKLTGKGMVAFIEEMPQPSEFWQGLIESCIVTNTNHFEIREYYGTYERKYLGRDRNDVFFKPSTVLFFDRIFKLYCRDNYEREQKYEALASRKLIDWLALRGSLDIFQLSKHLRLSQKIVKEIIREFTFESYEPLVFGNDFDSIIKEYENFLLHMIIVAKHGKNGQPLYELSLLGIMFALKMKLWGTLFDPTNGLLIPQGIHVEMPYTKYLSVVAQNYQKKLPLIFGKWNQLVHTLRYDVEYIFEPILNDDERQSFFNLSVLSGGNKELYDNLQAIAINVSKKLFLICYEGINSLKENCGYSEMEWYKVIDTILKELEIQLKYLDLRTLNILMKQKIIPSRSYTEYENELKIMEMDLGREITFLTYINLCKEKGYTEQWDIYHSHFLKPDNSEMLSLTLPLQKLLSIDNEIGDEISKWINDALKEQTEVQNKLKALSDTTLKHYLD